MTSMDVRKDNRTEFNILEHSEFGEIRIIVDGNGNPMFCGSDVATALGYSNGRDAIKRHCRGYRETRHPY
ncbi:MAG: Bro-N domain-containing protein [Eubacteriales bacterium]